MSLAPMMSLHPSPAALIIGFSVLLVLSLVAAEEAEVRRPAPPEAAEG